MLDETPHAYTLGFSHIGYNPPHYETRIEFTIPDPEKLLLPSPEHLQIRAACAKVAHLSEAAEYIENMLVG